MKRSFVLRIGPETALPQDRIQGQIEDVATGREMDFHSREQLLRFLEDILNASIFTPQKTPGGTT
jgi:hypothetical protein